MFDIFCPNYSEGVNGKTTSPQTPLYNCIAHSVGTDLTYIWPDPDEEYAWPPALPRNDSIDTFVDFYQLCGYTKCASAILEHGFEKVILYHVAGRVAHAALQLVDGTWTSKIGDLADIMHVTPEVVESNQNGRPAIVLRRKRTNPKPPLPPLHPPLSQLVSSSGVPLARLANKQ